MRAFGPKSPDHPSVGKLCRYCDLPFKAGDMTTLLSIGPADDEEVVKMIKGNFYNSEAEEIHWDCYLDREEKIRS